MYLESIMPLSDTAASNHARHRQRKNTPRLIGWLTLTGLMLFLFSVQAMGQGCAQCLDSTRATPPEVQAAYRHAILLMGGFGASFFVGGVLLLRKVR